MVEIGEKSEKEKRKKPPRIGQLMKIIYVWQRAGVVY